MVEAAAAGLTADCPICNTTVTVPTPDGPSKGRAGVATTAEPAAPFADPDPDAIREELIDASLLNGKLVGDLGRAREEAARFQQQLKDLAEEHERLNATATHAQRELKTFQTERQQLKGEAAALRQRIGGVEEATAARVAEVQELRGELDARLKEIARTNQALDQARALLTAEIQLRENSQSRVAETEVRLAGTSADLDGALGRLGRAETALGQTRETVTRMEQERTDLQNRLEDAGQRLTAAAELAKKIEDTETQLRDERGKLQAAEETNGTLKNRCEELTREGDTLRSDLKETHSGREVVEIRELLAAASSERDGLAQRMTEVEASLKKTTAEAETLRTERDAAQQARDEAREDAAALRDSPALKDNEVLRGIVARLNAELAQRTGEAARMKRAQYSLKIVYGIFGIGLLAVVAFALTVLPKFMR